MPKKQSNSVLGMEKNTISTKDRILLIAKKIFLEKGFEGASIGAIAKEAGINKSLIYHHFQDKSDLWKAVKVSLVTQEPSSLNLPDLKGLNLREFLQKIVTWRFYLYRNCPDLLRFICWQRLEADSTLSGISDNRYYDLTAYLNAYQQKGEIRCDIDIKFANYFICSTAVNLLLDKYDIKNDEESYINTLVELIFKALTN